MIHKMTIRIPRSVIMCGMPTADVHWVITQTDASQAWDKQEGFYHHTTTCIATYSANKLNLLESCRNLRILLTELL